MIKIIEQNDNGYFAAEISNKITKEDVETAANIAEEMINKSQRICVAMILKDFHGYTMDAFIADFKFAMSHKDKFERIALIGDKKYEAFLATISNLIIKGETKYFDISKKDEAMEWAKSPTLQKV